MSTAANLLQTIQHAPMQADQCRQQLCRDVRCDERAFSQSTSDASTLLHEEGLGVVPQPQTDCSGSTMVSAWETAAGSLCRLCCSSVGLPAGQAPRGLPEPWLEEPESVLLQLN